MARQSSPCEGACDEGGPGPVGRSLGGGGQDASVGRGGHCHVTDTDIGTTNVLGPPNVRRGKKHSVVVGPLMRRP